MNFFGEAILSFLGGDGFGLEGDSCFFLFFIPNDLLGDVCVLAVKKESILVDFICFFLGEFLVVGGSLDMLLVGVDFVRLEKL